MFLSDVWCYCLVSYCITGHRLRLHQYLATFLHPLVCPPLLCCLPTSVLTPLFVSFPSVAFSRGAFSRNIWVSQLWWIKTMCACLCVCDILQHCVYTCVCVWYVFDILKQCVCCIHLRQPFCTGYKSPSVSASHPGNLTGDATVQRQDAGCVCVFQGVCGEATSYYMLIM